MTTMSAKEPNKLVEMDVLGEKKVVYKTRKTGKIFKLAGMIGFLALAVAIIAYIANQMISYWGSYNLLDALKLFAPLFGWALLFFVLALVFYFLYRRSSGKSLSVYENGLVAVDRKKGKREWLWDEIDYFLAEVTKHAAGKATTHVYQIVKKNGDKIVFGDEFPDVEAMASTIRSYLNPVVYKRQAELYNNGEPCDFGVVKLSKLDGIFIKKKKIGWDEIEAVRVGDGFFSVEKKGKKRTKLFKVRASTIRNLEVLLTMIHQVIPVEGKENSG